MFSIFKMLSARSVSSFVYLHLFSAENLVVSRSQHMKIFPTHFGSIRVRAFRRYALETALAACIMLVFGSATRMDGQVLTGQIDGSVHDSSGAVVPNAIVTVTNTDQKLVVRTVKTDAQGQFTAPLLSIGTYSLTIKVPGFETYTVKGLEVHVGQPTPAPTIALSAGEVSQTVDVTAGAVATQLDSPASNTLINNDQVTQLPLSSRNYLQLLYIQPGISGGIPGPDDRGNITTNGQVNTQTFSVNGNGTAANAYFVDGADTLKRAGQQPVAFPGVDFIQEINLQRADYGAEFGGAGAAFVSVQTKSGSSAFHGGAFGFFRSQILNANAYFNKVVTPQVVRGGLRYADFGYYVGGPVLIPGFNHGNSKTFFFFGQEYLREASTFPQTITNLSTVGQRSGTFTHPVCIAYNANRTTCTATTTTIPTTRFDPTAQAYLKNIMNNLPAPNAPGGDPQGLTANATGINNESQTLIRIDHQFNQRLSVFFRYLDDPFNLVVPDGFQATSSIPGVATSRMTNGSTNWLGHFTYVISANHILEGGYAQRANWVTSQPIGYLEAANSPDIHVQLPYPSTLGQVPHVNINGSNFAVTGPYNERGPLQQIFLNNTNSLGRHTLKLGFNAELETGGSTAASANAGTFTFSPGTLPCTVVTPGQPCVSPTQFEQSFANFLLGNVTTFTQAATDVAGTNHTNIYEGYVQDDFRANNRLTLTAGMRYSYFASATTADLPGHPQIPVQNFDPQVYNPAQAPALTSSGTICTVAPCAGGKTPNPNYNPINGIIIGNQNSPFGSDVQTTPNKNFAPRIGFTYDVSGNGKQALRGGFGIYYLSVTGNQAKFATSQNPPNVTNVTINNTTFANPSGGTAAAASPTVLQALQVNPPPSYSEQYSLDFQQQIGSGTVLDVGYYGNHGVHLFNNIDTNQAPAGAYVAAGVIPNNAVTAGNTPNLNLLRPYVGYSAITTEAHIFSSSYNSLQATLRQRIRGGAIITASYTWARALTNSRTPQNSANLAAEYGPDGQMRKDIFNASFSYPLPFYKNQQGILGHILGGYQVAGIVSFGSGQYLTASTTALDPAGVGLLVGPATGRPDYVSNPNAGAPHSFQQWFNTASFTPRFGQSPLAYPTGQITPGNAGIGTIIGPGYENWDLSAYKNIKIERSIDFQLRAEAFNAFNHTNFAGVSTTTTASNYGQVTSAGPNRTLQVGGKLTF